jgi:hypothetical protein
MQQRQLRLGDILDDYCPRERRVTNHAIVAMIGEDVKHVRCTTCDADHEFKHAKVPRQRRKTDTPAALYAQVLASGPKRVTHEGAAPGHADIAPDMTTEPNEERIESLPPAIAVAADEDPKDGDAPDADAPDEDAADPNNREDEGPAHRRLIRASLPKIDGAPPPTRQIPEFTIRQPGGRPANRFRGPRGPRGPMGAGGGGGQQFQGNRSGGGGGGMRSSGGRPPQGPGGGGGQNRRNGPGRRRPK